MRIVLDTAGDVLILGPATGKLNASEASAFKSEFLKHSAGYRKIVLDLKNVRFIDSTGIGVLLSCLRNLASRGAEMKLASITEPVGALFELVQMNKIFEIYPESGQATASFNAVNTS